MSEYIFPGDRSSYSYYKSMSMNSKPTKRAFAMQSQEEGLVCSSSSHSYTSQSTETSYNIGVPNNDSIFTHAQSLINGHISYRLRNNSASTIESRI